MSRQKATRPPAAATVEAWSWRLAAVLVFVVGLHQAWGLYEIYLDGERLPLWDMARNGGRALDRDPGWVASQHRSYPQLELELTIFRRAGSH